jgi:hypothetical protein
MRGPSATLVCALLLLTAACGETDGLTVLTADQAYDGPLHVTRADADHPGAGAAGNVVECDTWGDGGFSDAEVYAEGATADSPEQALEVARSEGLFLSVTMDDLDVAQREEDRVLSVLEVDGVVKQALIVRDGPATEGAGGRGWYLESWARCDFAELPRSFTDSLGLQIWTDAAGNPMPTTKIESWKGPEHCDWQAMTFLYLDQDETTTFVRAPQPGLEEYFAEPFVEHAELPADAEDTGYRRDGHRLWISSDRQRAYVGTTDDVEVWPRTVQALACM